MFVNPNPNWEISIYIYTQLLHIKTTIAFSTTVKNSGDKVNPYYVRANARDTQYEDHIRNSGHATLYSKVRSPKNEKNQVHRTPLLE